MHDEKIVAVDFGSIKLSASMASRGKDEIEIYGSSFVQSEGIEKGFITNEDICTKAVGNVLKDLEKCTKEYIKEVYVGISSRGIRTAEVLVEINIEDGKINSEEIKRVIGKGKNAVNLCDDEEIADSVINFFVVDERVVTEDVVGWIAHNLKVNLTFFIGKKLELEKFKRVILNSGYILKGFVVNIFAGKNIFLQGRNSTDVHVLIDIGGGTSDYSIFKESILKKIGCIPIGGNNITKDLAICAEIPMGEAEKVKLIYSSEYEEVDEKDVLEEFVDIGPSKISKKLFYEVIEARLEEILKIVNAEIKNSSYYQGICSIIIYGDGIVYYKNIGNLVKNEFDKKTILVNNEYLGIKDSLNITSLAIVKEVADRLSIFSETSAKVKEVEYLLNEMKEETDISKKTKTGIVDRIKSFLRDIF
ncbi:MAG: cell division protein FtsA [Clostridium sp.]|nr:cell division protein FtsA [Clostridium sp.]